MIRWAPARRSRGDFASYPATVTIRAEDAKNGKEETLPLRPELAAALKSRMALFSPAAKTFSGMWAGKGAEMIRADLEAASILSRDAGGNLITVDEYGLSYDFHGLRHTFASFGAKAGILLAVMQKLMRHSDPKLTAGIYTHVLVADKAEELAKLPEIAARRPAEESAARTGTDTMRDTFASGFDGKIRNCVESGKAGNAYLFAMPKNEKNLVPQWSTGAKSIGTPVAIRTRDLRFRKRTNQSTHFTVNSCDDDNALEAEPWAVSPDKPNGETIESHAEYLTAIVPDDLCDVITSWPNLPAPIKVGIIAMVRAAAAGER